MNTVLYNIWKDEIEMNKCRHTQDVGQTWHFNTNRKQQGMNIKSSHDAPILPHFDISTERIRHITDLWTGFPWQHSVSLSILLQLDNGKWILARRHASKQAEKEQGQFTGKLEQRLGQKINKQIDNCVEEGTDGQKTTHMKEYCALVPQ